MSNEMAVLAVALGRVLIGAVYVNGGVHHFFALDPLTQTLKARGLPAPRLCLIVGSVFQTIAGALLIFGQSVRFAALGLIAFTIVATVLLVNFWSLTGEARAATRNAFLSNVAIIGGLLITAATATS
jgi:putative oxidoreductase